MNVLVTAIGSMSASCVIENLHNISQVKVIGTDIYPVEWQVNLEYLDKFYQVPKYYEKDYIETIFKICLKEGIGFIMPLTDVEIDVLNQSRALFETENIIICISDFDTILQCRDKSKTGSNIPHYTNLELNNAEIYPIIAKPKMGRSSEGRFKLENPNQLSIINDLDAYIFQPFIDGKIITVDVIRDKYENIISVSRKEHIRTINGAGIVVEIFKDKLLDDIVTQIANRLNIIGCVNFEFIYTDKEYYLMDVNPRFSAGVGFSCIAGYNYIVEHLKVFQDFCITEINNIKTGIYLKKTYIEKMGV